MTAGDRERVGWGSHFWRPASPLTMAWAQNVVSQPIGSLLASGWSWRHALALRFEAEPTIIVRHNSMVSCASGSLGMEVELVGAERLVAVLSGVNASAAFAALSLLRPSTTWLIKRLRLAVMRASPVRGSAEGVAGGMTRARCGGL